MLDQLLVLWPAFLIGTLHTIMPCEDKAIFCFWSFGVSKDTKQTTFILALYGLGLMTANIIIGTTISLLSFPIALFPVNNYIKNFFGALISIFVSIFMLFYLVTHQYSPHSKQVESYTMDIDWKKKRTPYIFGILAGSPPCVFEIIIYAQVFTYTASYGIPIGFLTILFFTLGTFLGLFPLAIVRQYGTKNRPNDKPKTSNVSIIMLIIIVFVNVILLIMAFFQVEIFPIDFFPNP